MQKKKIAIIGTNGIPARYGGFETLANYLTKELSEKYDFTVYCSSIYSKNEHLKTYNNAKLLYIPLKANGIKSILYDGLSTIHAWFTSDIMLILGPSAGFLLPLNILFHRKLIVNHGGLNEWEREKLSYFQRKFIYYNHKISAQVADLNVADNYPLVLSLKKSFGINAETIEYGGDHINRVYNSSDLKEKYPFLNLHYDLSISRAQIDNNLHLLLAVYSRIPYRSLVLISNWHVSEYGRKLKNQYFNKFPNIFIIDAIYDKKILDVVRTNTDLYIHSHSRCGTAPSLVEAMSYYIPIICYNVETNKATTENRSFYFSNEEELIVLLNNLNKNDLDELRKNMYKIAIRKYKWATISSKYEKLFN